MSTLKKAPAIRTAKVARPAGNWTAWFKSLRPYATAPKQAAAPAKRSWWQWLSFDTLTNWYKPKLVKTFTLNEKQITQENVWKLYDTVLREPFKYSDIIAETQLVPLKPLINEENNKVSISVEKNAYYLMGSVTIAGSYTILGATLKNFLSITRYQDYDLAAAHAQFNTYYNNHAAAVIAYCNKIIELGGNLGIQAELRFLDLLLDIEQLKSSFGQFSFNSNQGTVNINTLVAPFEELLQKVASKQNINFNALRNDASRIFAQVRYWDEIEKALDGRYFYTILNLIKFNPQLMNSKNPKNGKTTLDLICAEIFATKKVNTIFNKNSDDHARTMAKLELELMISENLLKVAKGLDLENIFKIIDLGAKFGNDLTQEIIYYFECTITIKFVRSDSTYVGDYAQKLMQLLQKICDKYTIKWLPLFERAKAIVQEKLKQQTEQKSGTKKQTGNELESAYRLLELEPNAPLEKVKAQHKKLAFQYHPDRIRNQIEAEIKKAEAANDIKKANELRTTLPTKMKEGELKMKAINGAYDLIQSAAK